MSLTSLITRFPGQPARLWSLARGRALAWWRILYLGAVVLVLVLSPSSYGPGQRRALARQLYLDTAPVLPGFTVLAALVSLVLTRITVVTALSYGLSRYALEVVIRVLVLELIPLTAAVFVAMRCTIAHGAQLARLRQTGRLDALRRRGLDPVRVELLPRAIAGMFACVTLAALSCAVALVLAYLGVYGFNAAGLPGYTRMFGQVFTPGVTLVFVLKTLFFSLTVALIPLGTGLHDSLRAGAGPGVWFHESALAPRGCWRPERKAQTTAIAPLWRGFATQRSGMPAASNAARFMKLDTSGLARMFAVLLLIELASLMSNYY